MTTFLVYFYILFWKSSVGLSLKDAVNLNKDMLALEFELNFQ